MNAPYRYVLLTAWVLLLGACGEIDLRKPRKPDPGPPPQVTSPPENATEQKPREAEHR
jgi:hypothetical protein